MRISAVFCRGGSPDFAVRAEVQLLKARDQSDRLYRGQREYAPSGRALWSAWAVFQKKIWSFKPN